MQCERGWLHDIFADESAIAELASNCADVTACNYNTDGSSECVYPNINVASECNDLCVEYSDTTCVLGCNANETIALSCNDYTIIENILIANNDSLTNPFYTVDLNNPSDQGDVPSHDLK